MRISITDFASPVSISNPETPAADGARITRQQNTRIEVSA